MSGGSSSAASNASVAALPQLGAAKTKPQPAAKPSTGAAAPHKQPAHSADPQTARALLDYLLGK